MKPSTQEHPGGNQAVLSDLPFLRKHARQHIDEGAVTKGCAADREAVDDAANGFTLPGHSVDALSSMAEG